MYVKSISSFSIVAATKTLKIFPSLNSEFTKDWKKNVFQNDKIGYKFVVDQQVTATRLGFRMQFYSGWKWTLEIWEDASPDPIKRYNSPEQNGLSVFYFLDLLLCCL